MRRPAPTPSRRRDRVAAGVLAVALAAAGGAAGAPETYPSVLVDGQPMVRIADLARLYGLRVTAAGEDRLALSSLYHSMIFEAASRRMSLMDVQVWLQHPVGRVRGRWAIHRTDADHLIDPILRSHRHLVSRGAAMVVLDAGHGGRDGGAESPATGQLEKDLTLDIARRVLARLPREGLTVRMTRDDDRFLELDERSRLAARWCPDVFVSIHCNSGPDRSAEGVETYILSKAGAASTNARNPTPSSLYRPQPGNAHDAASAILGFALQRRILRETAALDRGLRHARFAVLKDAPCAAALVECGFLSNVNEARRLADPEYRDRVAAGIARGILDYCAAVQKARLSLP